MPVNPHTLGPAPRFDERGRQTYDAAIAQPKRNALGERSGERYAEEGIWTSPNVSSAFVGGIETADNGAAHCAYDRQIAGQANGRTPLAGSNPAPTWDAVPREALASFASAASFGDPGNAVPFTRRGGAMNPNTLSPLDGLNRGERQATAVYKKIAPPNGGRGRPSQADVSQF